MKKMEKEPQFTSHILAFRSTSGHIGSGHAPVDQVKAVIDDLIAQGLVDENRIYVSGFSLGAGYTNELANSYLGFFAAIAPMAGFGFPNAEQAAGQDASLWAFVNNYDHSFIFEGIQAFVSEEGAFSDMKDAKVTFFETIESFVWPYNQWPTSKFPPYENWFGHEIEAVVLYNKIVEPNWNIRPTHSTIPWNDEYTYVFDWMFAQSKNPPALTEEPTSQPEEPSAPTNTEETAKSPEPTNTEETADPEDDSFPIWIIVIVVLVAIVVTGGIILLRKKTAK